MTTRPDPTIPLDDDLDEVTAGTSEVEPQRPPASSRAKLTEFTLKALSLAERFQRSCGRLRVVGPIATFRIEVAAPEGETTGGGKQSVQHISLVPDVGTTIVMGQADQMNGTCELRSYDYLAQLHARRFKGQSLPFTREAYETTSTAVAAFFSEQKLRLTVVSPVVPTAVGLTPGGAPHSAPPWGGILVTLIVVAILGVALLRMF